MIEICDYTKSPATKTIHRRVSIITKGLEGTIKDEKYWAGEAEKCKDFVYYYNNYVMTKDENGNITKVDPITREYYEWYESLMKKHKGIHEFFKYVYLKPRIK